METVHLCVFIMLCLGRHVYGADVSQRQKRNWIIESFTIDEGYDGLFPYTLGKVQVGRKYARFQIHGQGVYLEPRDIIEIDENTGEITVHGPVDFEKHKSLKLIFQAIDRVRNVVDTQLGVDIQIMDANDHSPVFDAEIYAVTVKESISQGTGLTTVKAVDADTNQNKEFDLRILSVTPRSHDVEFYFKTSDAETGTISFKGCLDYDKSKKYTIIVEAKDHGKPKQLSSSCTVIINIEDDNNHLPVISGLTGPGKVKEGLSYALILRLQVTDKDSKDTAAWRAKYNIQRDASKNFRITTDWKTNEGLLYVEKPLDYEEASLKTMTITVENEIPYFSCSVVRRSTTSLWTLKTHRGTPTAGQSTYGVDVIVEDVNEAPIFVEPNKQVALRENVAAGQYLATFTARDPDYSKANTLFYMKGEDPADWVTVDTLTGAVTTSKILDRESLYVKDNIYKATVCAVDDGVPPMTGTATLSIIISDENDNAPFLAENHMDMCQSEGQSKVNVTALDPDEGPNSGPFRFKLNGDIMGRWDIDPKQGYSVYLLKDNIVASGRHELLLEVSDLQGKAAVHNLSVTVCNCLDKSRPNCRAGSPTLGKKAGIISSCLVPLTAFLRSRKKKGKTNSSEGLAIPDSSGHLTQCNTENLGQDCQVRFEPLHQEDKRELMTEMLPVPEHNWVRPSSLSPDVGKVINEMLDSLHTGEELDDGAPRVYAEEGDPDTSTELDAISIPEIPFDPELDLDFLLSSPDSIQIPNRSTIYNITTSHAIENLQTKTINLEGRNIFRQKGKNDKYKNIPLYL
ncbi:cadherin-2A-like isoform X2 [Dunckerocampus dactyliophorus]|uniref:cadherin-2A-like isoform X2 n=1 Tax=Dunckerocampus dactyliophorus TaxID=161453 RepID=UPI00240659D9|nr:cadherin-2A-like isoform X2 [Dunckerocampus dactyliophorus]